MTLTADNTVLVLVDVQGNLAQAMHEKELLFENIQKLIKGCQTLKVPIIWAEQIPEKLGPTIPEIATLLSNNTPIAKSCFSCFQHPGIKEAMTQTNRKQVMLAGIETHVCIYQTAIELVRHGFSVEVIADAVSSRTSGNKKIGLKKMRDNGVGISSVEMAVFELMGTADRQEFKDIISIIK